MIWIRVEASPVLQIGGSADAQVARYDADVSIDGIDLGGEANANSSLVISRLSAVPMAAMLASGVGSLLTVFRDGDELFSGVLDDLALSLPDRRLTLQVQR